MSTATAKKQLKEKTMNLVRYNPNNRLATRPTMAAGVFDDLFNDFFGPWVMPTKTFGLQDRPGIKVDIYEKDNTIVMKAEMPGIAKEDISVDIRGKLITIGGENKSDEEIDEKNCYRRERRYGKFERTFTLPFEANSDTVVASFANGILKLEIAKPEEQVAKKITIN
jgi:HSP20 family protein